MTTKGSYQAVGANQSALFTLKLHRGDGMVLLAMNWRTGEPSADFVGFAIEYREPGGDRFFALKNRLTFPGMDGAVLADKTSTKLSPIQKFRWVHFPRNADLPGDFTYRVSPVFMNDQNELSYGEVQEAAIELNRETYPGVLNVTYTRGFVSSQAFVDRYGKNSIAQLLPPKAAQGLDFVPTHPKAAEALAWMGFEARGALIELLDAALADPKAKVYAICYDLNLPEVVSRFERLGQRLSVIIDESGEHADPDSAESKAAARLVQSARRAKRQKMGGLQHNKLIIVDGPKARGAVVGSMNLSWRGLYVQNNNAIVLRHRRAVALAVKAFEDFWANDGVDGFGATASASWQKLKLTKIDADIAFSPHLAHGAVLDAIAEDLRNTQSSLFFSLAFLSQTPGAIIEALRQIKKDDKVFSYGIADKQVKTLADASGIALTKPDGRVTVVYPQELARNLPQPFKAEPSGGGGVRMHHKFLVIDFNLPTARVYMGSYNFSKAADFKNGENLLCIRDRRVATSYMVEALRIFDHYHFRVVQAAAKSAGKPLQLKRPPRKPGEKPWWKEDFTARRKILDRKLFA
ncbi:MAG TPA: phospholipase D-like domain-containing protein [Lacunisphaera sp.]|nr:phospholipase D-like domain-containing protein [Lacunisphaera sp.]